MLCQDDFMVFTLHGTHTYCRGCINGWSSLLIHTNPKLREDDLRVRTAKGKRRCPFLNCSDYLDPKVTLRISIKLYEKETNAGKLRCS